MSRSRTPARSMPMREGFRKGQGIRWAPPGAFWGGDLPSLGAEAHPTNARAGHWTTRVSWGAWKLNSVPNASFSALRQPANGHPKTDLVFQAAFWSQSPLASKRIWLAI